MEISTESQAPSTDTSKQPPPIHNHPIIIVSPPPLSNLTSSNTSLAGRQILKPVAPSKRPVPENSIQNSTNNFDAANAFLPKELAEIVANRQRRERAWHARLMLCTTRKKKLLLSKAYLLLAIANFAAIDTSPAPPQIPSYSRPTKFCGHGSGKYKTTAKEVTVTIPRTLKGAVTSEESTQQIHKSTNPQIHKLPKPSQLNERTWVTVARNGQKKAPLLLTKDSLFEYHKSTSGGNFLLRQNREIIVQKLSISPSLSGKIKPVHSGFALSSCSTEARQAILDAGNGLFLSGAKLEPATNWIPVIIPTVPSSIRKVQGQVEINHLMLTDEVKRVCSMRPAYVKLYGRNKSETPHRTWMAYFPNAPRTGFRVFDESGIARPFKKQQPLEFCKRCNGHHPTKNCSRAPSCGNCGSTNHSEDLCMATTKCRNCGSPHRSDCRRCLARPTRSGAPTKEQMKAFRQAGEREFQAVLRAKTAEESATSTEDFSVGKISSQTTEVDANANIIPSSPVDISMGDALRL
ncbi:putative eka-like protein [Erysiphe necator]|uniref:Putative eka-like protein n=1 Tax=Uncinula necator TaxID=52586 RepID=A0A0B1P710_UNCNE|nr:putative eka-like protein [Erysiphe necator]